MGWEKRDKPDRMVNNNILAGTVFCMLLSISPWTSFTPLSASLLSPRPYQFGDTWRPFSINLVYSSPRYLQDMSAYNIAIISVY